MKAKKGYLLLYEIVLRSLLFSSLNIQLPYYSVHIININTLASGF